jgi:hypothetical protein
MPSRIAKLIFCLLYRVKFPGARSNFSETGETPMAERDLHVLREVAMREVTQTWPMMQIAVKMALSAAFDGVISGADHADVSKKMIAHFGHDAPLQRLVRVLSLLKGASPAQGMADPPLRPAFLDRQSGRPWSAADDDRLLAGIHREGLCNWTAVAEFVGGDRTRSQCSQRWGRVLDPTISKAPWTPQEDERLVACIRYPGRGWMHVARAIGNRSDIQCKYRFGQLEKAGRVPADLPRIPSCRRPRLPKILRPFPRMTTSGGEASVAVPRLPAHDAESASPGVHPQLPSPPEAQSPVEEPPAPLLLEVAAPAQPLPLLEQQDPPKAAGRPGRAQAPPPPHWSRAPPTVELTRALTSAPYASTWGAEFLAVASWTDAETSGFDSTAYPEFE